MSHVMSSDQSRQVEYQARFLSSLDSNALKRFITTYTEYMKLYYELELKKSDSTENNDKNGMNDDNNAMVDEIEGEKQDTTPEEDLKDLYAELIEVIDEMRFDLNCIRQRDTFVKDMDEQFIQNRDQKLMKEIQDAEIKVQSLMTVLKSEEEKKRNKLEYDALAEKILEFGDKRKLEMEVEEAKRLKEIELARGRELDAESEKRNKQFQLLTHVLQQLEKDLGK